MPSLIVHFGSSLAGILLTLLACYPLTAVADKLPADPPWFRQVLNQYLADYKLPSLGVSVVIDGKVVVTSVAGIRKTGDDTPAEQNDRFHIGSIAKPITVTMLARFIEQGFFGWHDTVEQMFPNLLEHMHPDYRSVTIEQLLAHTSGLPYQPTTPESETDKYGKGVQLKRKGYVVAALKDTPEAPPGSKFIYGGGHILVAHYAEMFMGASYEDLMKQEVFLPLGMTTARFGSPATPGTLDAPWEHIIENGKPRAIAPAQDQFYQARSPVGRNLCMSLTDLGKIAAIHLRGAQEKSRYLKKETFRYLQTPVPPSSYGVGWGLSNNGKTLVFRGSTGRNLSHCHIVADENYAMCMATNIWYEGLHQNFDEISNHIVKLIQEGRFN